MSILTDDPPPSMRAVCTTGSRSPRNSDLLPLSTVTVLDPGARCETNRKGVVTVGSPWLLDPASIRRMDKEGSASESRDAMMHPDVPPIEFQSEQGFLQEEMGKTLAVVTSGDDDIDCVNIMREFAV